MEADAESDADDEAFVPFVIDRDRLFEAAEAFDAPLDLLVNNAAVSRVHDYTSSFTLEQVAGPDDALRAVGLTGYDLELVR